MAVNIEALSNPDKRLIEYLKQAMLIKQCAGLKGISLETNKQRHA